MGKRLYRAMLSKAKLGKENAYWLRTAFKAPGMEYSTLWMPAFEGLENPNASKMFQYGHVFVTLNISNAYRYALGNPYRLEFIRAIAESLKVLQHIDELLAYHISRDFPEVIRLIEKADQAVVLEIKGISRCRLQSETGSDYIDGAIADYELMKTHPGFRAPCAFRVKNLSALDIVAIHDLSAWPSEEVHDSDFQPDPLRVCKVRRDPADWLAGYSSTTG